MSWLIPLGGSALSAIVDEEDYERLAVHRWHVKPSKGKTYVRRNIPRKRGFGVVMHREILGLTDPTQLVDHINGDGLDNRKANLRLADGSENARNRHKTTRPRSSRFKGVQRIPSGWRATIGLHGKHKHLGVFQSEVAAAKAYDEAAIDMHGAFASPNGI